MATRIEEFDGDGADQLFDAGAAAKGEFRCATCGYGVTIHDRLPTCPMCRATVWEPTAWRPFTRSGLVGSERSRASRVSS